MIKRYQTTGISLPKSSSFIRRQIIPISSYRMGVTMRNKLGEVSARTKLIFVIVTMSIAWFIGLLLFIIGILLIVGVFGNSHEFVIEAMNCNNFEKRSVGCSRVYGYRAEGVVVIILSFFFLAWAVIFTVATIVMLLRNKRGSQPKPQIFPLSRTSPQQFATSQA